MSSNDLIANALSKIKNAEKAGKKNIEVAPASKLLIKICEILKKEKYISNYKFNKDSRGGVLKIELSHAINNIGVIKPRFSVSVDDFEKFETRYLPAVNFGRLIVSTPKGLLTHFQAKDENSGGVLIAYVY